MQAGPSAVSVVVAARNESHNLRELVPQLIRQNHHNLEVIVVNDRSDDNSQEILNAFKKAYERLKVVEIHSLPQGWTGKKHALSEGISIASNPVILLTDADCLPQSEDWARLMTQNFRPETEFVLGFSPYKKLPGLLNQFIQYETLLTGIQYLSFALAGLPYMGVGRNLAYRRETFMKHGFSGDERFTGGDDDIFVNRHASSSNTSVIISPGSHTVSKPKKTWQSYFKQKIRHLSAGKRYRKKDQTRLGAFSLATLVGWLLFGYLLLGHQMKDWILVLFVCRSLSFYSIFTLSGQKLKVKLAYWALPLWDLCYTISYPVVGLIALTAKKIKWS